MRDASLLIALADLVTASLNEAQFGVDGFVAERNYADWEDTLKDLDQLHIDVVPVGHPASELATRGSTAYVCRIDIGIRKRFGEADQDTSTGRVGMEAVDKLVLLVERIHEHFAHSDNRRLSDTIDAAWNDTTIRSSWDRPHLREHRQFTGIIRLGYRVHQELEVSECSE